MVILKEHPQFFEKYKDFATADPTAYLEVFSEVWEMFKLIIVKLDLFRKITQPPVLRMNSISFLERRAF